MKDVRAVLLDLDDTLYVCRPGEEAGIRAVTDAVSAAVDLPAAAMEAAYVAARRAVKERIDGRGSSHARLLYILEMIHALGRPEMLPHVRTWDRAFWSGFLGAVTLRPRAVPFLEAVRRSGRKIAIVTDLTVEVQLLKLERFDLFRFVDALAVSEEVPLDKPAEEIFRLAIARLGTSPDACVMVGDHDGKDGEGARRLGIPYVRIDPADAAGDGFDRLLGDLGIATS